MTSLLLEKSLVLSQIHPKLASTLSLTRHPLFLNEAWPTLRFTAVSAARFEDHSTLHTDSRSGVLARGH